MRPKCECGKEMFPVGWERDEDNFTKIKDEYVCRNADCKLYKDIQKVPVEVDEK